jgi:transcription initiation factor IIF auxiliary subunit
MAKRSVEYYNKVLKELDQNYYLIMNEYTQQYPRVKTYPEIKGYKKAIDEDLNNLKSLQSDFFMFKNDLEKDIKTTSMGIYKADKMIAKLDKENTKLKATLSGLSQASAGATGMFNDAQAIYNQSLLGNVYLTAGMVIIATYLYKNRVY